MERFGGDFYPSLFDTRLWKTTLPELWHPGWTLQRSPSHEKHLVEAWAPWGFTPDAVSSIVVLAHSSFGQTLEIKPLTHVRPLTFFSSSPANKRVIQSGTRNLPRSTHAEFGKHVCLNPLGDYGTKSRPDPAWKPGVSKLSLWAGCEVRVMGLKTVWTVASQLATAYQRIPLGSHWINRPPRLINWNQWMGCQEEEEERKSSPVRWRVG